ncbi:MAG: hypothetical protein QW818_01445 [Candidatus Aenigmatarchaeota archaeon]|nr:hypothetical protein [Candidatus Aenigmarchaeota archaeon]
MKSIAELPLVGFVGTLTIMLSLVVPPSVIKTTIDKETAFTYDFQNLQYVLLSILSNDAFYEDIGKNFTIRTQSTPLDNIEAILRNHIYGQYCLAIIRESGFHTGYFVFTGRPVTPPSFDTRRILLGDCNSLEVGTNALIVLPYREGNLVEIIKVGKK